MKKKQREDLTIYQPFDIPIIFNQRRDGCWAMMSIPKSCKVTHFARALREFFSEKIWDSEKRNWNKIIKVDIADTKDSYLVRIKTKV